jgi:hypothetical protein
MRGDAEELSEPEIVVSDDHRVRILTLNRPDRSNAFTASSYRRLARALDEADASTDVSVVLMEGAGRGFSSGVDLGSVGVDDTALSETFDDLLESLITFSKPLLASVHGVAIGFGATVPSSLRPGPGGRHRHTAAAFHCPRNDTGGCQQLPSAAARRPAESRRPAAHIALVLRNGGSADGPGRPLLSGRVTARRGNRLGA